MKDITIILDNGHGENTGGKRSPLFDDGKTRFYEWEFNRDVVKRICKLLDKEGIRYIVLVPETTDISLAERVRRCNAYCGKLGTKNCLLVSVHSNAASSDGKWHNASGFSVYVANNASRESKNFANTIYGVAEKFDLKGNRSVPKERYWQAGFYIIRNSKCPAVLTENLFYDNKREAEWLMTDEGRETIAEMHAEAIKRYLSE